MTDTQFIAGYILGIAMGFGLLHLTRRYMIRRSFRQAMADVQMIVSEVTAAAAASAASKDTELFEWHNKTWSWLPAEVREHIIDVLRRELKPECIEVARRDGKWWAGFHHGLGTDIRNILREHVCDDETLASYYPAGQNHGYTGWDDFWAPALEAAAGIRST